MKKTFINACLLLSLFVLGGLGFDLGAAPSIMIKDKSNPENFGDPTWPMRHIVELSDTSDYDVYYEFSTSDGSAEAGSDYVPETLKQVKIPAGALIRHAIYTVNNDIYYEMNETVNVTIEKAWFDDGNDTPVQIIRASAVGTIVNDDAKPVAALIGKREKEGNPCNPSNNYNHTFLRIVLDKPATGGEQLKIRRSAIFHSAFYTSDVPPGENADWNDTIDGWPTKIVTFAKDEIEKKVLVRIFRDCDIEENEFQVFYLFGNNDWVDIVGQDVDENNDEFKSAVNEEQNEEENARRMLRRWAVLRIINDDCEPVANFKAHCTEGIGELCVTFYNFSTCAKEFKWDFGDGTVEYSNCEEDDTVVQPANERRRPVQIIRHCYNDVHKYYTVTLTAYSGDCCNREDTLVKEDYIVVHKPAAVAFNAYPIVGVPGTDVQFTNLSGGGANKWTWDYGDGSQDVLSHSVMDKIHPSHTYANEGVYIVGLQGEGNGGYDEMLVPNLIYVDPYYTALQLLDAGETVEGEGWDNAIDQDVLSTNAIVTAMIDDAWAVFAFADSTEKKIHKIRLLGNNGQGTVFANNVARDFELWVSSDGVNFTPGFVSSITSKYEWVEFSFEPISAKYLKLKLVNAFGDGSPYAVLGEFQVFGMPVAVQGFAGAANESASISEIPSDYGLSANYPNPFNPETNISYQLPEAADVILNVYNIQGQLIATLVNDRKEAGNYQAIWSGKNTYGQEVAGGMYIYKIIATSSNSQTFTLSRKMTFLK